MCYSHSVTKKYSRVIIGSLILKLINTYIFFYLNSSPTCRKINEQNAKNPVGFVELNPKRPPMLADMSAGMLIKKTRLSCWPPYSQQVSDQRQIWGITYRQKASMKSTLALKPRVDITRSPKQGYQWPYEKNLCPPKLFLKKWRCKFCAVKNDLSSEINDRHFLKEVDIFL